MERQIVSAVYKNYSTFVVPEGVDLANTEQVHDWFIRWDLLYIEMKDGRMFEVQPYIVANAIIDYKRPNSTIITEEPIDETYVEDEYVNPQ